jgi:hypothetical protein
MIRGIFDNNHDEVVVIRSDHVDIEGLQVQYAGLGGLGGTGDAVCYTGRGEFRLSHSLIRDGRNNVAADTTGATVKLWNNILYGATDSGFYYCCGSNPVNTFVFYNNTVLHQGIGIQGARVSLRNNLVQRTRGDAYSLLDAEQETSSNISDDGSSPDVSYRSLTVTFEDEGRQDFHLSPEDMLARDTGISLASDPSLRFSDDIDLEPRVGVWDVGADER